MAENDDTGFSDYFKSDLHARRSEDALKRTVDRMSGIGKTDVLEMLSEMMGTITGIVHVYKTLGLKHQGAKFLHGMAHWMKKGVD